VIDTLLSKPFQMAMKNKPENMMNRYYIFIEKYLTDNEMKNIINEYERENVFSRMSVGYDITIDNEKQNGSGVLDDFKIYI
jgi:GTPase Era involved in 16S rRNA processing